MAYRRTENVVRRLAEREQTILDAAQSIAAESGMGAVQIAPVAHRADIAAGTVYRYFPSKNNLIAEVIASAAVLAEPVDANIDALRVEFRRAIASELAKRINIAVSGQHLPDQDARAAAPAIVGALLEGLIGPLAAPGDNAREAVQTVTLLSLRALGVVDARARGLVAQCNLP